MTQRIPIEDRYWSKVDRSAGPDECWPWTAARLRGGYGMFWDGTYLASGGPHTVSAHRWMYQHFIRPLTDTECVLHHCDNPPCVNLAHLFIGTHADNAADRQAKGRGGPGGGRSPGEANGSARLTSAQVLEMRALYAAGGITHRQLRARFQVSAGLVHAILSRKVWRHLPN